MILMLIAVLVYIIVVLVVVIPMQRKLYREIKESDERFLKAWKDLEEALVLYEESLHGCINLLKE